MSVGFPVVVLIVVIAIVFFRRHPEPERRARTLKRAGFTIMALFTAFFGAFVIGDTFNDPGGWQAAGLVALWVAPLVALAAFTWYRPDWAISLFIVLIAVAIGMSIWFAADPHGWRAFENRNGPIRTIVVFAMSAVIALLGLKRTRVAGVMLLVLAIVPIFVSSLGSHLGFTSLAVASSPAFIAGILFLLSSAMTPGEAPPGSAEPGPLEHPKAA